MKMWEREERRVAHLQALITKYGFESEPTLYYSTWAWKDIYNEQRYFDTAMTWRFEEEEEDF